ncbi:hypothetical protein BJF78_03925 [Pseudonocardia sp. CNS-139]|nr:hypothetical protein BJF78_03925 [Pseudonocardia sp. CNS-139]
MRGSEVIGPNRWNPSSTTTSVPLHSRRHASTPAANRSRLESIGTPNAVNSAGRNARPKPTPTRPPERLSSIASLPASCRGWVNAGITAPVTSRIRDVRIAAAARNAVGSGL